MGLFSFIGGLLGSGAQKKGINKASDAQMQYLNKAIDTENSQFQQTQANEQPFINFGTGSLGPLGDLLGLNGNDKAQAAIANLQQSPLYTSLFNTGQEAVLQNASATGGIRGGNTQEGLADFGRNTLAQVIQNQIGNLFGAAGMGQGAVNATGTFGANNANAVASLFGQQGDTLASKYLAKAGINAQNWNNAGGFLDQAAAAILPMIPGLGAGSGMGSALGSLF